MASFEPLLAPRCGGSPVCGESLPQQILPAQLNKVNYPQLSLIKINGRGHNHTVCVVRWRTATSATLLSISNLRCNKSATHMQHPLHPCPSATWFNKSATDL